MSPLEIVVLISIMAIGPTGIARASPAIKPIPNSSHIVPFSIKPLTGKGGNLVLVFAFGEF